MAGPLTLLLLCCLSKTVFAGLECDFERPCGWSFQSEPPGSDTNFRVVTGKREAQTNDSLDHTQANPTNYAYFNTSSRHGHNPAMIVSPYYQHTGMKCKLRFRYRLFGMPGAQIMITVQHRRVIDGIEPTQQQFDPEQTPIQVGVIDSKHTFIDSWKKETVDIGAASDPMRIRLECWAGQGVLPTDSSQHSQSHLVTMNNQNTECFIDDIELVGCDEEEWREGVCQSNKSRKYMCHKHGSRKCIDYDQICDMHEDCPGGEDEDASIHNCTSVPMGARCSFERSDSVCPGWTVLTNPTNSNVSWVRVNSTMTRTHASSKDLFFVRDHTYNNASGHFMFLRSGPQALFKSQLISPRFPPTWPGLYNKSSIFYNTCRIRFYYCFKGSIPTVHLRVIPGGGGNTGGKLIWSARGSHKSHSQLKFCTWERVNVDVPRQYREYHILFRGSHLFHNDEFAIDDFSMTPECFIGAESWQSSYIPDVYNFTTCGASGPLGPKFSQCDKAYNNTAIVVNLPSSAANDDKTKKLSRGFQTWVVPYTGQYRVIAYGAAGGWLPNRGDDTINYGARVESIFDWKERDELTLVIGQQGLSPCFNGTKRLVWSPNMRNVDPVDFYKAVGQACELTSNLKAFKKPQLLLGTGGGGATLIAKGDRLLLVAAGGGGVFSVRSRNSKSANGQAEPTNDNSQGSTGSSVVRSELNWTIAGGGGGAVCKQEDCNEPHMRIAGRSWSQLEPLSGGQCPAMHDQHEMFYWQMHGGFGGGGAACGPGAGGGGGYNGGDAGNASSGGGGQSYSVGRNASFESGYQPFDGYLLILPCRLRCPKGGGQCKFMPDGRQVCVCTNTGRIVDNPESDSCIVKVVSTQETTQPEHMAPERDFFLAIVIAVIILLAAIFFVIAYVVYQYRCSHLPKYKYNTHDGVVLRHFPATGSGNSQIEFNPNYEFACSFAELKEIPRNCVVLIKALGQGAFGEVYEGVLSNLPDEPMSLSIAVKTLPEFATEQSQLDFHMEALIMSKFHHQNIVRFIGVCFEKMPRFIVLELLSGGDLKSFLRENRPRWTAPPRLLMIDLLKMALDVARGCQYLEENHFIHRDIAARNCLLTTKESGRVVKIADFGMARDIYRADYYRKGGKAMLPVKWMPPEAFLDGVFTSKTDVWSFGVLLWEIFSMGYMPYPGRGNQEVMQLVTAGGRLESPNGCPAQIYQLMTQCWNTVADERPHFGTIVERVGYCIQDPEMSVSPLPPLVHRMASSASAEPPVTELPSQSAALTRSFSAARNEPTPGPSKAPLGEQMPTKGTGVHVQACEPYRPKCSEPLIPLTSPKPASAGSSASESGPADALLRPSLSSPPGSSSLGPSPNLRPLRQSSSSAKTPTFGAEGDDEVFLTSLGADVMRQSQLL